nr:DUF31 family protein [Mycoplasma leonicaptivi]
MNSLGWSVPQLNEQGQVIGLNIKKTPSGVLNSWVDNYKKDEYKNIGLARTIVNDKYSNIAMQTFQSNFTKWWYTDNYNEQIEVAKLLQNTEDLNLLVDKITDSNKKAEFKEKLNRPNQSFGVREKYRLEIFDELKKQNNGDEDAAAVIYTDYVKNQREKLKQTVNAATTVSEEVKKRMLAQIEKATDFNSLAESSRRTEVKSGTTFILDYELTTDGSYPTKWYFGTNYHVVDGFDENNLAGFGLNRLDKQYPSIFSTLRTNAFETKIKKFSLPGKSFKRVIDGRDFFKWDPNTYSADKTETNKEFLDFAIFEVDFSKLSETELYGEKNAADFAKLVTNNYANLEDNQKLTIASYDYLTEHEKIDVPILKRQKDKKDFETYDQLYAVSYPASLSKGFVDDWLNQYEDEADYNARKNTFSLWTNADYNYYKQQQPSDAESLKRTQRGGHLSHSIVLRTFKDKPGVFDRFLNAPVVGEPYKSDEDNKTYYQSGLAYLYKGYSPGGGASGSSIRNQRNELVSFLTTAYNSQQLSSGLAVRSNGQDLNNLFNGYNIPQYDLVYGGGKDQNKSFREELGKLRPNIKTFLFKNGTNEIPEKYVFKNTNNTESSNNIS